eukprot:scaffold198015_cov31-Tisochrysis_lutea.AAC.1
MPRASGSEGKERRSATKSHRGVTACKMRQLSLYSVHIGEAPRALPLRLPFPSGGPVGHSQTPPGMS